MVNKLFCFSSAAATSSPGTQGPPASQLSSSQAAAIRLVNMAIDVSGFGGAGTTQVVHVGAGEQAVDGARSCEIAPDSDLARSGGWQSRQADGWRAVRAGLVFAGRGGRAGRRRLGRSAGGACRRIGPHAGVQWLWWCKIAKARPARSGGGKAHSAHITRGCRAGAARVRARAVAVVHASSCSYYCQPWAGIRLSWVLCNHAWVETGVRGEDGKRVAGRDAAFL